MKHTTRRQFLKEVGLLGAAAGAFPMVFVQRANGQWMPGTRVHPQIDNLRVVAVTNPAMTTAEATGIPWARQEELVNTKVVWEDMDRLACSLAQTGNPEQAWKTILIKPPGKSWSDTVLAIKTNQISQQHTRSAVMSKCCRVATEILGVKPSNIHIYDACHGGSMQRDTPFKGLPEGVRVENTWGGSNTPTTVPEPWGDGSGKSDCVAPLVKGVVDILVNISMCKGHSSTFGGFTLTMKNHFGTFDPGPGHRQGALDYLIAINRTEEILGPVDRKSGRVLFPRQQLCIVDGIWSSKGGPGGHPTHQTNFIAMGVSSPAVDYLVATQFRGARMGWEPNRKAALRMLTEFGYSEGDLPNGGRLIEI